VSVSLPTDAPGGSAPNRQAVIVAPDRFEVRTAARPALCADDELLVRTAACGICSGDLMPWYLAKKVGTVLGHEVVGRAVQVGRMVCGIDPGDLVFLHHHAPCGDCTACARGTFVHCPTWKSSSIDPGGMAEWIRVPGVNARGDTFAVNDLGVEQAVFIEPLGCCVKAFRRLAGCLRLSGARGAVVGCGVMGLLNLQVARALGAGELFAVEPDPERCRVARSWGAVPLAPPEAEESLRGQMDFVIIGPGSPDVIRQALAYVGGGGAACLFTPTPAGALTPLDLGELYFREVSLLPSYSCGPDDTRQAYELLRTGRVDPRPLVTHRFALDDVQEAYATARRGGAALKVLVTFPTEDSS
jgi:L-iditol 2-dehydrogenase